MTQQRKLTFDRLDQIANEVERLLDGYAATGNWSLGQICHHLATALRLTTRASEPPPAATEEQAAMQKQFFAAGVFPAGRNAPPLLVPEAGLDDRAEADKLTKAIDRFQESHGPYAAHPVLGPLSRDHWVRFHCLHAAHHLGFVRENAAQ